MDTYQVVRRFFHKGIMQKPGAELDLTPAEAARLVYEGYIKGPINEPKIAKKGKAKNARFTD